MKKISLFDIPDDDERGVSPVIGVILMVAITVILAAVIATFVLGFPDQVNNNVNAGVDIAERDDGSVKVTWVSKGNAESLVVQANSSMSVNVTNVGNVTTIGNGTGGGSYTLNVSDGDYTIVVKGVKGSTETVVQSEDVTVSG